MWKWKDLINKSEYWHILQGATSVLQSGQFIELILNISPQYLNDIIVPGKKHKLACYTHVLSLVPSLVSPAIPACTANT